MESDFQICSSKRSVERQSFHTPEPAHGIEFFGFPPEGLAHLSIRYFFYHAHRTHLRYTSGHDHGPCFDLADHSMNISWPLKLSGFE